MGRYDKIRVRHNGEWKVPTLMQVFYNGSWYDLGAADSYNTRTLHVRNNNTWVRATLNRRDYEVVTDQYGRGPFKLLPASGFCYCPKSSSAGNYNFYFRCTIRKTANVDASVFRTYTGEQNDPVSKFYVTWLADGRIRVENFYNRGSSYSITTTNAVMAGQDVYLNIYANKGSYTTYVEFNGVTTSGALYGSFIHSDANNVVGDFNIQFRGDLSACGCKYGGAVYAVGFNAGTVTESTDGSQYQALTHVEVKETRTEYV